MTAGNIIGGTIVRLLLNACQAPRRSLLGSASQFTSCARRARGSTFDPTLKSLMRSHQALLVMQVIQFQKSVLVLSPMEETLNSGSFPAFRWAT